MGLLDAPHSIKPMGFFVRVFPSLLTSEVFFRKAFPRGLLRKEIEVMNPCVLRWGLLSDTKRANPRSYDAERRNEWDKEGAGAHNRKHFTFWPREKAGGETREGEGAKESKI